MLKTEIINAVAEGALEYFQEGGENFGDFLCEYPILRDFGGFGTSITLVKQPDHIVGAQFKITVNLDMLDDEGDEILSSHEINLTLTLTSLTVTEVPIAPEDGDGPPYDAATRTGMYDHD